MTNCSIGNISFLTETLKGSYPIYLIHFLESLMRYRIFALLFSWLLPLVASAESEFNGKLTHQNQQLGGSIGNKKGNRHFTQFEMGYIKNRPESTSHKVLTTGRFTDANEFMFSFPEAHITDTFLKTKVQAGRFILPWAPMDRVWSLGYLNHRRNFTFYDPGQEGLIGVGITYNHNSGFYASNFASPIYIPELNPSSTVKDGSVTSKNIWVTPPPTSAIINGVNTPIYYYLEKPDLSKIIFRGSYGQEIGYKNELLDWNAFYMLKPENNIRPAGDARLTPDGKIIANLKAKLYYHELYGTTLTATKGDYRAYASLFRIDPRNSPTNDPLLVEYVKIETELERRDYGGFGVSKENAAYKTGLNWIALLSAPKASQDLLGNKSRFREALDYFLTLNITEKLKNTFDMKLDFIKGDKIFMEDLSYDFGKGLTGALGFNIIDAPSDNSFWSGFRGNDAVYGNATYSF